MSTFTRIPTSTLFLDFVWTSQKCRRSVSFDHFWDSNKSLDMSRDNMWLPCGVRLLQTRQGSETPWHHASPKDWKEQEKDRNSSPSHGDFFQLWWFLIVICLRGPIFFSRLWLQIFACQVPSGSWPCIQSLSVWDIPKLPSCICRSLKVRVHLWSGMTSEVGHGPNVWWLLWIRTNAIRRLIARMRMPPHRPSLLASWPKKGRMGQQGLLCSCK